MSEQQALIETPRIPVRELAAGASVNAALLVRAREVRQMKDGRDYLTLTVADRTGETRVKVWPESPVGGGVWDVEPGKVVRVRGRYVVDEKWGAEIALKEAGAGIRLARENEIVWDELLDGPEQPLDVLEKRFRDFLVSLWALRNLVTTTLDGGVWDAFVLAPAASGHHHAYRHGLLEHTVQVATLVDAMASEVGVRWHVAVAGALLHDVGKIDVYTLDPLNRDVTDEGRLYGEIPQSYYRVRRAAESLYPDGIPEEVQAVLHVVAAHHGQLDFGSPVTPATREAFLVHYADMISSRMGGFDRVAKKTAPGERWSAYDRGLGGRLLVGGFESG